MHKGFSAPEMLRRVAASCFFFLLLSSSAVIALDPSQSIEQYVRDVWQAPDTLPQNTVRSIAQTRDGYIWFATEEGLVRFDGARFMVFDRSNTKQLLNNFVTTLLVGRDGSLWIGTSGGGLTRFGLDGIWTTYTNREGLLSDYVATVFEDRGGSVWIGTLSGLNRLQDGRLESHGVLDGAPKGPIVAICEDRGGSVWVGSRGGGLARFQDGKFTIYERREGLPNDTVRSLYGDRNGNLWIGTDAGGLTRFADGKFTTEPLAAANSKAVVVSTLLQDHDGGLWIGTREDGIRRRRGGNWETYRANNGLPDQVIGALFEDREGSIWVGTLSGGVTRFANGKFTVFGKTEGLSDDHVLSVFEDREQRLWIGTRDGGLDELTQGVFHNFRRDQGALVDSVSSIFEDREGSLWLGDSRGLNRLEHGRFIPYGSKKGLPEGPIPSIYADREGSLWIGTFDSGLYQLKDGRVTSYSMTNGGLTSNFIVSLLADHQGALWIGTGGGGLDRLENGRLTPNPGTARLSHDAIEALYEDRDGSLWIATSGQGLGRLKAGRLTVYAKKDGLFDDVVLQLLEDGKGYLWMGCNRGIFRVRKGDFDAFDAGRIRIIPYVLFGRPDGLRSIECNGVGQPSAWQGKDGRLWFATEGGVAVVDPARIRSNPVVPSVLIEEVLVDEHPIDPRRETRLPPDTRRVEIHYTAPSFVAPARVRFRYRLEGFDRGWIDAGARRVAYYTNLSPGPHRFRVIACNNDGVWNDTGAMLEFSLLPAFYQTTWFLLLSLSVAVLLGWAVYQWRVRQVTARLDMQFGERLSERTRIARELHDSLLQSFQGLMLQFQKARNLLPSQPADAIQTLDGALDRADQAIAEGRDAIQGIRSASLDGLDLTRAITALGEELAATTEGPKTAFRVSVEGAPRALRPIVRDEIYRIAREALRNAFHHARASRIEADITYGERRLRLRIRDDGTGIHPDVLNKGGRAGHWGLVGIRERARLIGVQLEVWSREGAGTEVDVGAPGAVAYEGSSGRSWSRLFRRKMSENEQRRG